MMDLEVALGFPPVVLVTHASSSISNRKKMVRYTPLVERHVLFVLCLFWSPATAMWEFGTGEGGVQRGWLILKYYTDGDDTDPVECSVI